MLGFNKKIVNFSVITQKEKQDGTLERTQEVLKTGVKLHSIPNVNDYLYFTDEVVYVVDSVYHDLKRKQVIWVTLKRLEDVVDCYNRSRIK